MMNNKLLKGSGTLLLMMLGLLLCFSSCQKHVDPGNWDIHWPIIDFSFSPKVPKIGETVQIQAQSKLGSSDVVKWEWEFLDSSTTLGTAEGQSASFVFPTNGSYQIRLVGTDSTGNTDIVTKSIDVAQTTDYFVKENAESGGGHSWDNATNLSYAIKNVVPGSKIYIAAGTYHPSGVLTNSDINLEENKTFEISTNVTIIGGFPADATQGDVSDPESNTTILSGNLGGGKHAFHVAVISAPKISGKQVVLKNLTVTEGVAGGDNDITVDGTVYSSRYGAGLNIGGSNVSFTNVNITNNTTDPAAKTYGIGIYARPNSELTFRDCKLNNNKDLNGNSGALRIDNGTVYMYDCEVKGNTASGTSAGMYFNGDCIVYLYNTVIANNIGHDYAPGLYIRGSKAYIVNCLVTGNTSDGPSSKHAGGLFLYKGSEVFLVSTTVSDNETGGMGGGIRMQSGSNELTVFNSIVSGNRQSSGKDIDVNSGTANLYATISGQDVYDDNGTIVTGESFDADNDLNNDFFPIGSSNPALNDGLDASALSTINTSQGSLLEDDYIKEDINGKSRSGKTIMGALVE